MISIVRNVTAGGLAVLAVFALSLNTGLAQQRGPSGPGAVAPIPNPGNAALRITCSIKEVLSFTGKSSGIGPPKEWGVVLTNTGSVAVPTGTKIHWVLSTPRREGDWTFTAPLAPSYTQVVANLGVGFTPGSCTSYLNK